MSWFGKKAQPDATIDPEEEGVGGLASEKSFDPDDGMCCVCAMKREPQSPCQPIIYGCERIGVRVRHLTDAVRA
jgi:hypothetical protein